MYSEKIIKRFENPQFVGEIKNPSSVGEVGNRACGDIMRVYIKVEKGRIKDIKFKTYGCMAAIATSDALCELAKGKTLGQAKKINFKDIVKQLGGELPKIKIHCSVLGAQALKKAIENYEGA